jgi:uncharacterized membrane protein HdeD (DUF308 family)
MNPPKPVVVFHAKFNTGVRHLVLAEAEEQERFKRRLHLHGILICAACLLFVMSAFSMVDTTVMVGGTFCLNGVQEFLDYAGRF